MSRIVFFFALIVMICHPGMAQDKKPFAAFDIWIGVWKTGEGASAFFEQWKKNGAGELAGTSYKIKAKDTIIFERVIIRQAGKVVNYLASVKNQNQGKEVPFRLVSAAKETFIFENKEHDFPQRVIYQFVSTDSLHAWIEGTENGKARREDYFYSRIR